MATRAQEVVLTGGDKDEGLLLLRTDAVPFRSPAKESGPDSGGFKHRRRRATPEEEKKVLKEIGDSLSRHFSKGRVPCQLREFMKGYELWYTDKWHQSAEILSADGDFLRLIEKDDSSDASDAKDLRFFRRKDYYLYGHPTGEAFRSSPDVAPHVMWLAFDTTGLGMNCTCYLCLPLDGPKDNKKRAVDMMAHVDEVQVDDEKRTGMFKVTRGCHYDLHANNRFILRTGEIGWFDRSGKGQEWRLGVVKDRFLKGSDRLYVFQAMSNPEDYLNICPTVNERNTKIFLAMTLPATRLSRFISPEPVFDAVDWVQAKKIRYPNPSDSVVDSSILAAKQVDSTYTLLNRMAATVLNPLRKEYFGIFIGAEKVWVGDAVRLHPFANENDNSLQFFVIRQIFEDRLATNVLNLNPHPVIPKVLHLIGDTYKSTKVNTRSTEKDWLALDVPGRVAVDLTWINDHEKNSYTTWQMWNKDVLMPLSSIAGRWHPAETLLEHLQPSGQRLLLNNRMHQATYECQRRKTRKHAFGKSVPDNFEYSNGVVADGVVTAVKDEEVKDKKAKYEEAKDEARKDKNIKYEDDEDEARKGKKAKYEAGKDGAARSGHSCHESMDLDPQ